jgi:tetratricopeptide (TPR) repeat protein
MLRSTLRTTSILDGLPRSEAEARKALEATAPAIDELFAAMDLSANQRLVLDLLKKGHLLADIYGLTHEEREAMFARGCHLVQAGEIEKGRDWLMFVHQLNPRDARVVYVIAVTYQAQGNFSLAGKLFAYFIALNATNPEGYLRLGECLLSAQEYERAVDCFAFAKDQCASGKGDAAAAAHADKMFTYALEKQRAVAAAPRLASSNSKKPTMKEHGRG